MHDRIVSGIAHEVQIGMLVYDTGKIPLGLPDAAKHEAGKTVSVKTVRFAMRSMVEELDTSSNFLPYFETMVSSMQKKIGCDFKESGISFKAIEAVMFMNPESSTLI